MSIIKTKSRGINLTDNFAFTGTVSGAGIDEIDQWILGSDFTTSGATVTGWIRSDMAGFSKIGTGMTGNAFSNNGYFAFPKTGLYSIRGNFMFYLAAADTSIGCILQLSTNMNLGNSASFTSIATANVGAASVTDYEMGSLEALVNVTDITTHSVKFFTDSFANTNKIVNSSTYIHTGIVFERIGDAQ